MFGIIIMVIVNFFSSIIKNLQQGTYKIHPIKEHPFFDFQVIPKPIMDEAELFEEASKTLLYYWCVNNNDQRYKDYYNHVLIPDTKLSLPSDITFDEILSIVGAEVLE